MNEKDYFLFLGSAYEDIAEVRPSNRTSRLRSCDRTRVTGYALNRMDDMGRSEPQLFTK